ncbi:hypothetical protein [Legionella clemsonensis]|uniref:Uncharacterized protein n=1 Tax=Legionella clemsonensis TaxID=1867846 RepID=A0A222P4D2_9GAMM|nr:hypothetical protein [Legionella clemsonensis]ASQ46645.1 hypothetical protein clem_10495 [Legionella clemsonensis]
MREKTESSVNNHTFTKYIFVRSDRKEKVQHKRFNAYQVTPAHHMNLSRDDAKLYEDSGYLSTFMLTGGMGLEQVLKLNTKYVHFICIDKCVCEHLFLTGGTRGLTIEGKETTVQRLDGTSWQKPPFNPLIPQLFFTNTMQIELGLIGVRDLSEVLLGGNWQDFAQIYSLERTEAREMLTPQYRDDKTFYNDLNSKTTPYTVASGIFRYTEAKEKLEKGQLLQQAFTWWNQLESKSFFCFIYGMFYRGRPYELAEVSSREIWEMHRLHLNLNRIFANNPEVKKFFTLNMDIAMQFLGTSSFDELYQPLATRFVAEIKNFLALPEDLRTHQARQRIPMVYIIQKKLNVEICFWRLYKKVATMRPNEAASHVLHMGKDNIIQGWHIAINDPRQHEIITSLMTINENLRDLITIQILNRKTESASHLKSSNHLLGEWFKEFAARWSREHSNHATLTLIPSSLKKLSRTVCHFNRLFVEFSKCSHNEEQKKAYLKLQDKLGSVIMKATHHQALSLKQTQQFMEESLKELTRYLVTLLAGQIKLMHFVNLSKKLEHFERDYLTKECERVNMDFNPG